MGGSAPTADATYNSVGGYEYCKGLSPVFPATVPGGNPAVLAGVIGCTDTQPIAAGVPSAATTSYTVADPDVNFGSSVITGADTTGTVSAVPLGQMVGGLSSAVNLGLLNGTCVTALTVEFVFFSSTTSMIAPLTSPAAEGVANRQAELVGTPTDPSIPGGLTTGNDTLVDGTAGVDDIADSDAAFVTAMPAYYPVIFDPDADFPGGPGDGTGLAAVSPIARYTGATRVPTGADFQALSFFIFNPNDLAAFATDPDNSPAQNGRVSHLPNDSYVSTSILNDPTASLLSPSTISDFCSPLSTTTMLLGTSSTTGVIEDGVTRAITPAAGTRGVAQHSWGTRDADGDGYENAYDPCPFAVTLRSAGTPLAPYPDTDADGIPNACDPTPGIDTGLSDHDSDGFQNRQDICPLVGNGSPGTEGEAELLTTYKIAAPNSGPKTDSIGDLCDPDDATANTQGELAADDEEYDLIVKCIGPDTDTDNDDFCGPEDLDDTDAAIRGYTLNQGFDVEFQNPHGDGSGGNREKYNGTSATRRCGGNLSGASETWAADLVESNSINISDVLALKPIFGTSITTVAGARNDVVPSKSINISDVLSLKPLFGTSCTIPQSGTE